MAIQWYALHTYAGKEDQVAQAIRNLPVTNPEVADQIQEVLVPMESVAEIRRGERKVSKKRMFPGYIVVAMEMNDETQSLIKNIQGVTAFVGPPSPAKPIPLSKAEVEAIMAQMETSEEDPRAKISFGNGDRVKVVDGPFLNFCGVVEQINEARGRLTVMVDILGRSTPVELDFLQVEKIA